MPKLTVKDLFDLKGKRQLTEVYVSTPAEASACEAAGIDMMVTSESNDVKGIRAAAPNTFFTVGFLGSAKYATADDAVRFGFKALSDGGDAIYAGVSLKSVEAMANEAIPVVGHVGFIPYKNSWFGGFKAVGKTADVAIKLYKRTLAYQEAGAIGVEMEIVPHQIATEISKRVKIMVLSMGSGTGCDGQYLFAEDILGTNTGHVPRHAKMYRNLKAEYKRLHNETIAAFADFKADVASGGYPAKSHVIEAKDEEYQKFLKALDGVSKKVEIKEYL
jgi:3-methyl-2-oxobutanoate hydroxymethyltransferase